MAFTGLIKLWPMHQIWQAAWFCKLSFIGTHPHAFIYVLPMTAFFPQQQSGVATETYGPNSLKYLLSGPYRPWSRLADPGLLGPAWCGPAHRATTLHNSRGIMQSACGPLALELCSVQPAQPDPASLSPYLSRLIACSLSTVQSGGSWLGRVSGVD